MNTVSRSSRWLRIIHRWFGLQAEIFPLRYRATVMALSTASNWTWDFLIAFFTPFIKGPLIFDMATCLRLAIWFPQSSCTFSDWRTRQNTGRDWYYVYTACQPMEELEITAAANWRYEGNQECCGSRDCRGKLRWSDICHACKSLETHKEID